MAEGGKKAEGPSLAATALPPPAGDGEGEEGRARPPGEGQGWWLPTCAPRCLWKSILRPPGGAQAPPAGCAAPKSLGQRDQMPGAWQPWVPAPLRPQTCNPGNCIRAEGVGLKSSQEVSEFPHVWRERKSNQRVFLKRHKLGLQKPQRLQQMAPLTATFPDPRQLKLRSKQKQKAKGNRPSGPEKWKWKFLSRVSDSLQPHGLYSPWNSPGQNTGVGSHSLLQSILKTQGSNPGLLHCRRILYQLSHKGRQVGLGWEAIPLFPS